MYKARLAGATPAKKLRISIGEEMVNREVEMGQAGRQESQQDLVRESEERARRTEQKLEHLEKTIADLKAGLGGNMRSAQAGKDAEANTGGIEELRREPMMAHLLDALESGKDIGHYGRLVFAMVAHHFLSPEELQEWLMKDSNFDRGQALALIRQVESRDYNPPRRDRILAWQAEQEFPIIPNVDDPDYGNVYRNLKFPQNVYEHIQEYQEDKIEGKERAGHNGANRQQ